MTQTYNTETNQQLESNLQFQIFFALPSEGLEKCLDVCFLWQNFVSSQIKADSKKREVWEEDFVKASELSIL
jgi:hypothetical protein